MVQYVRPGDHDSDRFDRVRRIGWIDLDAISRARVMVAGAGALGNEVVKNLVLSGFRDIDLVDMDHVVISNLSRCLFFRDEDEGRPKAEVVAERAMEMDREVRVTPLVCRIEKVERWDQYDLVLGCLDNIMARLHVNSHSYLAGTPYIDGGTMAVSGKVQVVIPPDGPCFQCGLNRSHYRVLERRFSCTGTDVSFYQPRMPAEITTTSVIAAIQVREALKLMSGMKERCIRHILHYNGLTGGTSELSLDIDPACPMH